VATLLKRAAWPAVTFLIAIGLQLSEITSQAAATAAFAVAGLLVVVMLILYVTDGVRTRRSEDIAEQGSIVAEPTFTLAASHEYIPNRVESISDGRVFRGITMLWVSVSNNGPDATFSAQVRGISPVKQLESGNVLKPRDADDIAWEHGTEPDHLIRGTKRSRLRLGAASRDPFCFWLWGPQSTTWAPETYQWGWRLVPRSNRVTFALHVINTDTGDTEERDCFFDFNDDASVADFGFEQS
jgi:hypothetical protein